jgi:hypothetical protein
MRPVSAIELERNIESLLGALGQVRWNENSLEHRTGTLGKMRATESASHAQASDQSIGGAGSRPVELSAVLRYSPRGVVFRVGLIRSGGRIR